MVGFVPGLPWCFQMVAPERQLEVPKYLRPRTDTPALALSHGGAFAAIYPVQGPGGYQLFASAPRRSSTPRKSCPTSRGRSSSSAPGTSSRSGRSIARSYDSIRAEVEAKTYRYRMIDVEFDPQAFFADPDSYNAELVRRLYA